jgi:putative endonuclease
MRHRYFVYNRTSDRHTASYTDVTNDLVRRVGEHRSRLVRGFTARHNVNKLVYFEKARDVDAAIAGERQINAGSWRRKFALVNSMNWEWRDLFDDLKAPEPCSPVGHPSFTTPSATSAAIRSPE